MLHRCGGTDAGAPVGAHSLHDAEVALDLAGAGERCQHKEHNFLKSTQLRHPAARARQHLRPRLTNVIALLLQS